MLGDGYDMPCLLQAAGPANSLPSWYSCPEVKDLVVAERVKPSCRGFLANNPGRSLLK